MLLVHNVHTSYVSTYVYKNHYSFNPIDSQPASGPTPTTSVGLIT